MYTDNIRKTGRLYEGKRGKMRQQISTCPHSDRLHFAKGMCRSCYKTQGRQAGLATNCRHTDQQKYSLGLCQKCYNQQYKTIHIKGAQHHHKFQVYDYEIIQKKLRRSSLEMVNPQNEDELKMKPISIFQVTKYVTKKERN